jgi:hypothetical protein
VRVDHGTGGRTIASDPARYANDFFDITDGNNQTDPNVPGYSASPGWDLLRSSTHKNER